MTQLTLLILLILIEKGCLKFLRDVHMKISQLEKVVQQLKAQELREQWTEI